MPFGLGFFAAGAGEAPLTPAYDLISTQILGSTTGTITFSSIPSTYKHLQIRMTGRMDSGTLRQTVFAFNGDTTAGNYYSVELRAANTSWNRLSAANNNGPFFPSLDAAANRFGAAIIDIFDYKTTHNRKALRYLGGGTYADGTLNGRLSMGSITWNSTNAITSISISAITSSYLANSRFSLYGIRA